MGKFQPARPVLDPRTSRDAEDEHTATGARARNCDVVLSFVGGGRTASEIAEFCHPFGIDLQETRRRLTDLKAAGTVVRGEAKRAANRGKRESVWRIAEKL